MKNLEEKELTAGLGFVAAMMFALLVAFSFTGCEHGALITLDPDVDICAQEGVEECCPDCTSETDITLRVTNAYNEGYEAGSDEYRELLERCLDSDDEDSDTEKPCNKPHKKPHKNTRGKGHIKHSWDVNLDSDDPLEGITVSGITSCTTTCRFTPNGSQVCETVCRDRFA